MPFIGCETAMKAMNIFFNERILRNRESEVLEELRRGTPLPELMEKTVLSMPEFKRHASALGTFAVVEAWPEDQHEVIRGALIWALDQRQRGVPMKIRWKGDDENPEFVTRIEIRGNELFLEFAHPPALSQRISA